MSKKNPVGVRRTIRLALVFAVCAALGFIPVAAWLLADGASAVRTGLREPMGRAAPANVSAPCIEDIVASAADPDAFRRRAATEPAVVAAWLDAHPDMPDRLQMLEQLALVWANHAHAAAIGWARGLPNLEDRECALRGIAGELARAQPIEALQIALLLEADGARDAILRTAVAEWTARDADASARWVWDIADTRLRADLLSAVIIQLAERDPATAAIMAEDDLSPGRARDDVLVSIFQRWTQQDASLANRWLAGLPDGAAKASAAIFR